ncbi:MAG: DNA polymerase III subunit epsilon [Haliscomenobacteraceae bacterium CHB4]|nr:DNA polymerase III PolC-type [Saprospiraceae bacterium]MCE7925193.1 DNA polymerase III subunit epsilon [Haliscomenobacteraceae bacterium CHB4]
MYAIIDVETTGGVARFERITEIAIVLHDGQAVVDTFSTLINPEQSIPWQITMITGITDEMVAQAPKFYEVAKKVVEMTEGAVFVAHNVSFDYSFVREEFARLGYPFSRQQLCTVRLARKVFPGLPSYSLSNLKKHFGIEAERSHRALDDTLATVRIFEMILAEQGGNSVKSFLRSGIREAKLPPAITLERLDAVPETCGVYYLHDERGEVIYVGKSLNIRKRLFEHFADLTPKGEKLRTGVADISFEITGSELVALLLESAEIKRLLPRVNRALRARSYTGCIFTYTDQNGYRCLAVGKRTSRNAKKLELVADYPKVDSAKLHLQSVVRQYELCYRLSNLDASERACFHYSIKKCRGACIGEESPEAYNERVEQALETLNRRLSGSFFILEPGRTESEMAVVGVQEGRYLGFGYADASMSYTAEDLLECLAVPYEDPDAGKIIRGYVDGKKGVRVVKF